MNLNLLHNQQQLSACRPYCSLLINLYSFIMCVLNADTSHNSWVLNSKTFLLWDHHHHKLVRLVNNFAERTLFVTYSTALISVSHIEFVARETPFTHDELTSESRSNSYFICSFCPSITWWKCVAFFFVGQKSQLVQGNDLRDGWQPKRWGTDLT